MLKGKRLTASLNRPRMRQGYLHSTILFNFILEVPASTIKQEIHVGEREVKFSTFTDDIITHVEDLKESIFKNLQKPISSLISLQSTNPYTKIICVPMYLQQIIGN